MQFLRSRTGMVIVGGLLVIVVAVIGAVALNGSPAPSPTPSPSPTASPSPSPTASPTPSPSPSPSPTPVAVCPLDGTEVEDPALATRVPMLVQIENNPIARPPAGLNLADLVIEAPVEGDTTRFAAVFMCSPTVDADVGPVRSLRYFNIDLFQQLRAVTFNFGGAAKVLASMATNSVPYVNGIRGEWSFYYRAGPWGAPHNVYFDVDAARVELESGGLTELAAVAGPGRAPFAFDPAVTMPAGRPVNVIGLQTASFWRFGWEWDAASGRWLRTDAGAPNSDRLSGERIQARTVMVQVVEQEILPGELDPGGYPRRIQFLTGEGSGVLFVDGQAHDVRWSRPSAAEVTTWTYTDTGEPVVLPPGRVWWEIIPVGSAIGES